MDDNKNTLQHNISLVPYFLFAIRFILFGNIYVALGAACLVQSTCIQLQTTSYLPEYSFLVFFATLFIYNLQRFFYMPQSDNSLNSIRRKWIFENQKTIKALTIIGFIGVLTSFFFNDYRIVFYLSPLLLLSVAYFIPAIKLRKSPFFKLFTLVLVWTMVTAVLPVLLSDSDPFSKNNLLHILLRFCFMMAICIPFDIRDMQVDAADKVNTLPQLIGEKNTKKLAIAFMLLYFILIIPEYTWGIINTKILLALLLSAVINLIIVAMSSSKRGEYFYIAGIDGTMILQGLMLIMAELFL
jgi:4-hydroxybenzoate polyprenyltransferase